jgi:hypothetical protein
MEIEKLKEHIENYKKKAYLHIYYLKWTMIFFTIVSKEIFNQNIYIITFIVLFNIAFIKNMIDNLNF